MKSAQRDKVKKFISLTQTGEQTAIYCLTNNDWKLEQASDNYFQAPEHYYRELDKKKVEQLFNRYRDPCEPAKINSDGVVKFLDDLHLSPESKQVLIIAWKFRAQQQCEFTRDEFVNGFTELGVDSIEKLKAKLQVLEGELRDANKFKDFYQFTFNYAKEHAQKGIDLEMAIAYWNIVLQGRFKFLELWCKFLTVSENNWLSRHYSAAAIFENMHNKYLNEFNCFRPVCLLRCLMVKPACKMKQKGS